ncbi:3-coathanger stack domain-containing protein [Flavivirga rizhaonensis]|uniref:DUF6443 domain-containing protein n=1 Tax=Flavivirga rizhaonensis TaxID=2559571 RepID=A0A4S1DTF4_9FLAO|nr:3-coathanger stack domain-containing protein [Flavivirga rizhaonensis]TGV01073.1 hypothetical protein EM932_17080 [Flavivirga rizhaonensis]
MKHKITKILFFLLLMQAYFLNAQEKVNYNSTEIEAVLGTTTPLQYVTANLDNTGVLKNIDPMGYISLYVKENEPPNNWFSYALRLNVTPASLSGAFDGTPKEIILKVEHNTSGGATGNSIDISKHIAVGAYGVKVELIEAIYTDLSTSATPVSNGPVPANIGLELGFNATTFKALSPTIPSVTVTPPVPNSNEVKLSWNAIDGAMSYDVEWTWVDGYDENENIPLRPLNSIPFTKRDFELNNTRVQTSKIEYNIPLIYAKGYLIYRVRAVGRFLENTNVYRYGKWSEAESNTPNFLSDWNAVYTINDDHQVDKNWQFQASYAEEGKKKEVVSYFDGTLRNRQTVTKINSDDNIIVGEVIYDAQGRPAVEVLPVPTNGLAIDYKDNFNLNSTGQVYSYQDFDTDDRNILDQETVLKAMDTLSGASKYYSPENDLTSPFKNRIPDAKSHPFSQIEYMPDNTGRILRKGGVGTKHQLGSTHEMEYHYGTPEQKELNRLFGYSVGHFSHYKKNTVIDPNRQASVSYIDPQGRTIATALAGISPSNLDGLDDEIDAGGTLHKRVTTDLLGKLSPLAKDTITDNNIRQSTQAFGAQEDALVYSATKLAIEPSQLNFKYTLGQTDFEYTCISGLVNYPVVYDLFVDVLDIKGNSLVLNREDPTFDLSDFTLDVPRGSYSIIKNLVVNKDTLETYADQFIKKLSTPGDACYIDPTVVVPIPTEIIDGCFVSCEDCESSLITEYGDKNGYRDAKMADYDFTDLEEALTTAELDEEKARLTLAFENQWEQLILACNAPCEDGTDLVNLSPENRVANSMSCSIARTALLDDMKPSGQYGQYPSALIQDGNGEKAEAVIQAELNIFNDGNRLVSTQTDDIQIHNSWRNPRHPDHDPAPNGNGLYTEGHYYNTDGTISYIKVKQTTDEEGNNTYAPDIQLGVELIPVTKNTNNDEYLVEPQYLTNVEDFIASGVWQNQWAESLIVYHPEYCYLQYAEAVCGITKNVTTVAGSPLMNSDGYDLHLRLLDTYTKAGAFVTGTSIMLQDPFFYGSVPPTLNNGINFNLRTNIMNEVLTKNYNNTGLSLEKYALAIVTCNSVTNCNVSGVTVGSLTTAQKDEYWSIYKSSYSSAKEMIQTFFGNIYAEKNNCYNGCIGEEEAPINLLAVLKDIKDINKGTLDGIIKAGENRICDSDVASFYATKEKRFKPSDNLYDSGQDAADLVEEFAGYTGYEYYIQTGVCPLARDLQTFLEFSFKDFATLSPGISGERTFGGKYLSRDLYQDLGGNLEELVQPGDVKLTSTPNGVELTLRFSEQAALVGDIPITITIPATRSWNNYADTGVNGWVITKVSHIKSSYDTAGEIFTFKAVAQVRSSFEATDYEEIIISGSTQARISDCSIVPDSASVGQYLGNGETSGPLGDCNKKQRFSRAFITLLNHLYKTNTINATVPLNSITAYSNSYLSTFFGGGTATWSNTGSTYFIEVDGVQRFILELDENETLPTTGVADFTGMGLNYEYNSEGLITHQNVQITYLTSASNKIQASKAGTLSQGIEGKPLINFLCCGDINDIAGKPDPTNCTPHFGFVFAVPNRAPLVSTSPLANPPVVGNDGRLNIGKGIVNFINTKLTDTLYITTIDDHSGGNARVRSFETDYNSAVIEPVVNSNNEVTSSGILQIQDFPYSNTVNTIFTAINNSSFSNNTTGITIPMDITFVIITGDNVSNIESTKTQYNDLLANNKSKKVFFIILDDNTVSGIGSPYDYVSAIINKVPVDYSSTLNVLDSDFIMYSTADLIDSNFENTLRDFLLDAYNDVCQAPEEPKVTSCLSYIEEENRVEEHLLNILKDIFSSYPTDPVTRAPFNSSNTDAFLNDSFLSIEKRANIKHTFFDRNVQRGIADYSIYSHNPLTMDIDIGRNTITIPSTYFSFRLTNSTFPLDPRIETIDFTKVKEVIAFDMIEEISNGTLIKLTYLNDQDVIEEKISFLNFHVRRTNSLNSGTSSSGNFCGYWALDPNLSQLANSQSTFLASKSSKSTIQQREACGSDICIPPIPEPVSCTDKYPIYTALMNTISDKEEDLGVPLADDEGDIVSEDEFCANSFQYLVDDYQYYITTFGITSVLDLDYMSIARFGATEFNYGYSAIRSIIDLYSTHVTTTRADANQYTMNWAAFTSDYLNQPENQSTCVPAPFLVDFGSVSIDIPEETPCEQFYASVTEAYSRDVYANLLTTKREEFINAYLEHALSMPVETFNMEYPDKEYQYTLYYYDQAGNLLQTVPPEGVDRFTEEELEAGGINSAINLYRNNNNTNEDTTLLPDHDLITTYRYNSLNQLVWQFTPDGGETRFAYDELGRIVASQNAKQLVNNRFSYTNYDELGRITEAGEFAPKIAIAIEETTGKLVYTADNAHVETSEIINKVNVYPRNISDIQYEVTTTGYDKLKGVSPVEIFDTVTDDNNTTDNTRNRVAAVYYYDLRDYANNIGTNLANYNNALFYNYDIHGNVKELVQHNKLMVINPNNFQSGIKRVLYEYDLISGNVNKVSYQNGKADMFAHRYTYDADNRITMVETSSDGMIWEKDATYQYYAHGPLARTVLGEKEVQGMDYAYTLQGWLKGVNSETMVPTNDMGTDGTATSLVAQDAMGYSLNYFDDDYQPIGALGELGGLGGLNTFSYSNSNKVTDPTATAGRNLYNGNIKQMVTSLLKDENLLTPQLNNYGYDQLNRIKTYKGNNIGGGGELTESYSANYTYDRNGNLKTLNRSTLNGSNDVVAMDQLTYDYKTKLNPATGLQERTNQLDDVQDALGDTGFNDLETQPDGNYTYDEIGQLIKDTAENLDTIIWRVDGKVKSIEKTNGDIIHFQYDGLGNRISKTDIASNKMTLYTRDAQGNVLAVYNSDANIPAPEYPFDITHNNLQVTDSQNFTAVNTIATTNTTTENTVEPTGNLSYTAGESITLSPNFHAKAGSTFTAKIEDVTNIGGNDGMFLTEHHIFGSSRLGLEQKNLKITEESITFVDTIFENVVGDKRYELSNHLGNVLSVVTDRKLISRGLLKPDVVAYNDYYPFGQLLPNRHGSSDSYRYGFQGQEKDDEIKGEGNSLNYKFRMHDPRVGRFFAVDPLSPKYPSISPYSFSENNVMMSVELEGLEKRVVIDNTLGNPKSTDIHDVDMGTSKAYDVINSDFGAVIKQLKGMDLINSQSTVSFTHTGVRTEIITTELPWYFGGTSKDEHIFVKYDVSFEIQGADFSVPVEMTTGLSTHFEGSNPIDYALVMVGGKFIHKSLFQKAIQKSVYAQAAEQMFKNFYGTTRGKLLERLAATTKYSSWKWLDDVASNFPTFDFVKGGMYSSFKTFKGEVFPLSKFKSYVNAIKGKIDNGFKFKSITYKPTDGTLDILVPKSQLKEFIKEGGKHYNKAQQLIKHGKDNGVKVIIKSNL